MTTRRTMLTLLVSDEEKKALEELAEATGGGGMSAYVRRMIRQEAQRYGLVSTLPASEGEGEEVQAVPA